MLNVPDTQPLRSTHPILFDPRGVYQRVDKLINRYNTTWVDMYIAWLAGEENPVFEQLVAPDYDAVMVEREYLSVDDSTLIKYPLLLQVSLVLHEFSDRLARVARGE